MKSLKYSIAFILTMVLFTSCEKELDRPPVQTIPEGDLITIQEMRSGFNGTAISFEENKTLIATVTADEASGNLYREVYLDDGTGAIVLRLEFPGGLTQGDKIRINLTNLEVTEFAGTLQLGVANVDNDLTIIDNDQTVEAVLVTIDMINTSGEEYEAKLLKLEGVEFASSELALTYANAITQQSESRAIVDCDGNTLTMRNSGYASFAGETVAQGNGTLYGVLSEFNGTYQLKIRGLSDVILDGVRCDEDSVVVEPGVIISQDFSSSNIFDGGWTTQLVTGTFNWETSSQGGAPNAPYAKMSNYSGGNTASEAWLISPSIDLSTYTTPKLKFISAVGYFGDDMEVYVSTDYDGTSLPSTATWTALNPVVASTDPDFWAWFESGDVDLSAYLQPSVYLAWKYSGSDSDGATWELDDILVYE